MVDRSWVRVALWAGLLTPLLAMAEPVSVKVDAQPLGSALNALAEQLGLQLVYDGGLVADLEAPALSGRMEAKEALQRILAGTGLTYRFTSSTAVTLQRIRDSKETRLLDPVRVEGMNSKAAAGVNGSSDPTATEGTKSYTSGALSIASKTALSMRDTPQSVSVVTRQRIEDQNLTDVAAALNQATGVTLVQDGNTVETQFFSRGFEIQNFQLDGGTPLLFSPLEDAFGYLSLPDLAQFDHVEMVRGADGLFAGSGEPGGVVNLVRKRPLGHQQISVKGHAGSWNNYRGEIDATGPLDKEGRVRGRIVSVYEDRDYFYDTARSSKTVLYGIAEVDLASRTTLSLGGSAEQRDVLPWSNGLPRYVDGRDIGLPRDTCLCARWSRFDFDTSELFVQLDHALSSNWTVGVNVTRVHQTSEKKTGASSGSPDRNFYPSILDGSISTYASEQLLADITTIGTLRLWGREHQIVIGANWQDVDGAGFKGYSDLLDPKPVTDVFNFDPDAYPEPGSPLPGSVYPMYRQRQSGAYLTMRSHILERVQVVAGARFSSYEFRSVSKSVPSGDLYAYSYDESGIITPYAGIVYDLSHSWSLYASYADIFVSQAAMLKGPPPGEPVDPVTGSNYEVGAKAEWFDGALNATLALYRIERNNQATSDPTYSYTPGFEGRACCYRETGQILSEGFDAELTGEILPGWQVSAGYTFNQNKYNKGYGGNNGSVYRSRSPKHVLKLWSTVHLPGAWSRWALSGGINLQTTQYVDDELYFYDADGNLIEELPYRFEQGTYAVFSARAQYAFDAHWSVAANVGNIFDRNYYQTVGSSISGNWYGEPRNFMLTMLGKF